MALTYVRLEKILLKDSCEYTERWLQERIMDDPGILGLGDVELVGAEKVQPRAGRLDLVLYDEELNRRYEVELMLGPTDPSHIIRCIEYWDIERRRYPAYEHVAVLVAEDITSRFLNVMALMAGNIPMIAIQLVALRVEGHMALHFSQVLNQTALRSDDEYELRRGEEAGLGASREYWEQRAGAATMEVVDEVERMVNELSGRPHRLRYLRRVVNVRSDRDGTTSIWLAPRRSLVHVGGYVEQPEEWVKRLLDREIPARLARGNNGVRLTLTLSALPQARETLREFVAAALRVEAGEEA